MRHFRKQPENRGHVNRQGLWKYSRHPNYLGEILMWWGVCLLSLSAPGGSPVFAVGALVNTLMFVFVSVPLMERRQLSGKREYAAYKSETGALLPRLRTPEEAAAGTHKK
jgi:steroid 5-alpha reductase family enzyme